MAEIQLVPMTIRIPKWLHNRVKEVSDFNHVPIIQLIQDGLISQIDMYDERHRRRKEQEEAVRSTADKSRMLKPLNERSGLTSIGPPQPQAEEQPAELSRLYDEQGTYIAAATGSYDKRMRIAEAVSVIRKRFPLSHPPESAMMEALEASAARKVPQLEQIEVDEQVIDTSKIRSMGDV